MTLLSMTIRPIRGTRFVWLHDASEQSWCLHEDDDVRPVGLYDAGDPGTGFARAAVLRHGAGFALFIADRKTPGRPVRALHAAGPEVLRSTYEKRLPQKRCS